MGFYLLPSLQEGGLLFINLVQQVKEKLTDGGEVLIWQPDWVRDLELA